MTNKYLKRIIDDILKKHLEMIGAVVIVGPKWCGKTTTAEKHAKSVLKLQDPDNRKSYLELAEIKPSLLLEGEKPRLIDEWQMAPALWDAVRTSVDDLNEDGLYILTGSTSVNEEEIMHSGTGRFSKLIMRPMSLFESKESNGKISIIDLFDSPDLNIDGIKSKLSIENLIFAACRGGWPESLNKKTKEAQLFVASNYINNICEIDASTVDGVKRDPKRVKTVLQSYARNISTLASNNTILKDIKSNFPNISEPTYYSYIDALTRLFVIDNIDGWNPNIRSATSIRSGVKREFIDPSIAVALLGLSPEKLIYDLNTFGFIFENLCIRDLSVYSSSINGKISYYRDRVGLEVDCVLQLEDGRYGLIEFKLGSSEIEKAAENLLKLDNLIKTKITENKVNIKKPSFLAIVTGGQFAYTRPDGIKILPIACLK
ncbi:ATP-binding protein [Methanobrevibacter sp. DSM 116169]|uniref:ATP-binding protein n=1 Tax=Methanobrevibacter sp. DSM 116169 TaxID=3242727 RepID=UPI0038FD0A1D